MALNRARVASDIKQTGDLSYQVDIEFFDSAVPGTVLWAETFIISAGATTTQLQAVVVARGQAVRTALAALAAARTAVPNQTVITVP